MKTNVNWRKNRGDKKRMRNKVAIFLQTVCYKRTSRYQNFDLIGINFRNINEINFKFLPLYKVQKKIKINYKL